MTELFPPRVALIAAVAANGVIGRAGGMPWHLPEDFRYFRETTMGRRMVMGRRTWESLPGQLPGREHVVLSRRPLDLPAGVRQAASLEEALRLPPRPDQQSDRIFVIGGAQIYALALAYASDLYLTEIRLEVQGDTCFPAWDRNAFREVSRSPRQGCLARGAAPVDFAFVHYVRNSTDETAVA